MASTEIALSPQRDNGHAVALPTAGITALGTLSDGAFRERLQALTLMRSRVDEIHRALMVQGSDYGVIPGAAKPTLLKAGAEKLCQFYGLVPVLVPVVTYGDGKAQPHITVTCRCDLHQGSAEGPVVGVGHGAASSWERRYRYRRAGRKCPACQAEAILERKASDEEGPGWFCWRKRGGCGRSFPAKTPEISSQVLGDVEISDPYDLLNTLVKMSEKRAHVDGTLRATATSGLYAQDTEEQARKAQVPYDPQTGEVRDDGDPARLQHAKDNVAGRVAKALTHADLQALKRTLASEIPPESPLRDYARELLTARGAEIAQREATAPSASQAPAAPTASPSQAPVPPLTPAAEAIAQATLPLGPAPTEAPTQAAPPKDPPEEERRLIGLLLRECKSVEDVDTLRRKWAKQLPQANPIHAFAAKASTARAWELAGGEVPLVPMGA